MDPISTVRVSEARWRTLQRLNLALAGSFAVLALLLASIALYGVVSHLTARRSREFGVRLAVGATPAHLVAMVFRESLVRSALLWPSFSRKTRTS